MRFVHCSALLIIREEKKNNYATAQCLMDLVMRAKIGPAPVMKGKCTIKADSTTSVLASNIIHVTF